MPLTHEPDSLRGLQLDVPDPDAGALLLGRVLGLRLAAREAHGAVRFELGACWLQLRQKSADQADVLHWRCADLAAQRAKLAQLGIDTIDAANTTADELLQVASVDTGTCTSAWTEGTRASISDATPRLVAVTLRTRAPERVAAHWSQMLHSPVGRGVRGSPQLEVDSVALSFTFAEDGVGSVHELTLAVDWPEDVHRRAEAAGVTRSGDTLSLAGLSIRIV